MLWISILMVGALLSCGGPQQPRTTVQHARKDSVIEEAARSVAGNFSRPTSLRFDSLKLDPFFQKFPLLSPYQPDIRSFYKSRQYSFAWYDASGPIEHAANLVSRFRNLAQDGITGSLPYIGQLDSLMENQQPGAASPDAETELLMTGLYFYFANKVWGGLGDHDVAAVEWFLPRKKVSYESWLDSLLRMPAGTTPLSEPVYRQYGLLKTYLKRYTDLQEAGSWKPVPATKSSIRPGDSSAAVALLRRRLQLTGDLHDTAASAVFDSAMLLAVRHMQHRFGMKEDGLIGNALIKAMNVPLTDRIRTIMINMERSRWLPMEVQGQYIAVNIPEFKLHVYNTDSLLWDMDVVVGRSVSKTVVFSGRLNNIVFSPYWNIPASIVKAEVLPGIKRNAGYLASHHMERYAGGFRQLPGTWNSLGQVKFLFPNSYSIYLHDTPSKSLFGENTRAFSHGCIRVAEPEKLAAYLLSYDTSWNRNKIREAMNSGKEKWVTLAKPLPVFITYLTAWVDRQGNLNFRDDIYNRDTRLAGMIMNEQH